MTARLPVVAGDSDAWGSILNSFLQVGHNAAGANSGSMPVFNVKDDAYGCKVDGVTDDTTGLAAALAAANAAGGGVVSGFNGGTCLTGNQTLYAKVIIDLQGGTIKLKNGANTDLFSADTGLINLSALGGSTGAGTLYGFVLRNGILDGNKANQTGGPSWCLRFYGCDYLLENLDAINGYSGNIQSDWNGGAIWPAGARSMESRWINVKTTGSNGVGISFGGPHDSQFFNVIPYLEGTHCLQLGYNSYGTQFSQLHAWTPGQNDGLTIYGQDDFGRANQSGLGTASDGLVWTEAPASSNVTAAIVANQASFTGNGTEAESVFYLGSTSAAAIDITERLNLGGDSGSNTVGIAFRYTDINNYYRAAITGNTLYFQKFVAGVKSTVTSTGFSLANNTNAWMRVQASGTTIKIKIWLEGNAEPGSWNITQTDSALSTGKVGIGVWMNSSTATVDSFVATSVISTPLSVAILDEAQGAVYFSNSQAESSRSVQVAVLGSGFVWDGGNVFGDTPYTNSGFQIGQPDGATPYTGQLRQSAGVTTAYAPTNCRIESRMTNVCGPNGALWLADEGAGNEYDLTVDMGKGNAFVGTMNNTTNARIIPYGLTADGSRGKGGYFKFAGNSFNAMEMGDGTNVQFSANTNAGEWRWGNGAYLRVYSDNFGTILGEFGGTPFHVKFGDDANVSMSRAAAGVLGFTGAIATAQSATTPDPGAGGTISTANTGVARVTPAASRTGVILQAGAVAGQKCTVINNSASFTITFATAATSNVAQGVSLVIAALSKYDFTWDSVAARWY